MNHSELVAYFENMATQHTDINSFYRFNPRELMNDLGHGAQDYTLVLEAAEIQVEDNMSMSKTLVKSFGYMVLGKARHDDEDQKNSVVSACEEIGLEIERRVLRDAEDPEHVLYNKYDPNDTFANKVGPIYGNRWGYRFVMEFAFADGKRMPNVAKWGDL